MREQSSLLCEDSEGDVHGKNSFIFINVIPSLIRMCYTKMMQRWEDKISALKETLSKAETNVQSDGVQSLLGPWETLKTPGMGEWETFPLV